MVQVKPPDSDKEAIAKWISALNQEALIIIRELAKENHVHPTKVSWAKFKSVAKNLFLEKFDYDVEHYGSSRFNALKEANFLRKVEHQDVVHQDNKDKSTIIKSKFNVAVKDELFFQKLEEFVNKSFSDKITINGSEFKYKKDYIKERELNLILSDLHFGSLLDGTETSHKYTSKEEARRLAAVIAQVCDYKRQYRDVTTLNIHLLGDIIQNQLHDPRDGAPLAAQACAAIYLLIQAFSYCATQFPRVVIRCASGNHGRNGARHKERAVLQKWDSIETIIYYSIKQALSKISNVAVIIPKTPFLEYESFGMKVFGTHGDTVLNPGNPGRSINISSIENQINRINASLKDTEEYKLFFVGHVHVGSFTQLANGAAFITNGALIPPDSYAVSIGIFENSCGQTMWETVPGHIVGDYRYIRVDSEIDKNESLDKIIKPFDSISE